MFVIHEAVEVCFSFGVKKWANGLQAYCIDYLLSLWCSSGGNKLIGSMVGAGDGDAVAVTTPSDKINTGYISYSSISIGKELWYWCYLIKMDLCNGLIKQHCQWDPLLAQHYR